ncbi:MAG: XdhC family protein [Candidatus Eremiobacteraeota bacterium]|nr:XdhC family protein [Candidatus Eremiobacteraeota bacterium]
MTDLVTLARESLFEEGAVVLVSLVEVSGSTYRKTGARMMVTSNQTLGLMSGGCLEEEIARKCRPLLLGEERFLRLDIDTRQFLGCDGRLGLWCERVEHGFLKSVARVREQRRALYCNTYPDSDRPSTISEESDPAAFHELLLPPRRVLVFGSAPDSQPLLSLCRSMEWEAEQIVLASDPNATANSAIKVLAQSAHISKLGVDSTTACVVMNHHFGRDLELLHALWQSSTLFLGLLGSRRRRDELLEQLALMDVNLESRELFAPVGLSLGAEGPHEIALAICAQIMQVFNLSEKQS